MKVLGVRRSSNYDLHRFRGQLVFSFLERSTILGIRLFPDFPRRSCALRPQLPFKVFGTCCMRDEIYAALSECPFHEGSNITVSLAFNRILNVLLGHAIAL